MTKFHEEKIEEFLKLVINFDANKTNLKRKEQIFNPWNTNGNNDIEDAYKTRCCNLKQYLLSIEHPNYILIAESPSKGARYTGIAMTAEKTIKDYNLPFQYTSKNNKKYKRGESTATKVWKTIAEIKNYEPEFWKTFVLWNAFAFNIHVDENKDKWFENPLPEEVKLDINKDILNKFLSIYPKAKIIAVGGKAKTALESLGIKDIFCVRHPSNDYAKDGTGETFPEKIAQIL